MTPPDNEQFVTNKQLLTEIREKQRLHDEKLEEHKLKIERNRLEIEHIKRFYPILIYLNGISLQLLQQV